MLLCTKLQRSIPQATLLFYYPGIPVSSTKILESPTCSTFGRQIKKEWINRMKKRKNMTCETDSERSMCVRYHNLVGKLTLHPLHAKTTDICGSPCSLNPFPHKMRSDRILRHAEGKPCTSKLHPRDTQNSVP